SAHFSRKPSEEDDHEDNQLVFEPVAYGYLSVGASFLNGTPTPEISWWSHRFALAALKQLGWEGDPSLLWDGRSLATLAAESRNPVLAEALAAARPSLGGWMSLDDARVQLASLVDAQSRAIGDDATHWFSLGGRCSRRSLRRN
ncbi:MAG: hypothetical protein LC733_07435, partial [Actinobacteria bacterium]|nr:hypothetical protein [Actinomycetota bacterium]